ncbi:MAG: ATP-binding protein [bacterium]
MAIKNKPTLNSKPRLMKLLDFFVLFSAAVISALLIWYNYNAQNVFRKTLVELFQSHQLEIVKGSARGIENLFFNLTNGMLTLASSKYVSDPTSEQCHEQIRQFYLSNQDFVYAGYRMDRNGILVYMYPMDLRGLNADIRNQEHVVKLFNTRRLVVSGLFRAVEGFDAIAIHSPVFVNKKFNGSVATVVKLEKMTSLFLQNTRAGKNGYAWMVDDDGTIIYHPNSKYIGQKLSDTNLFNKETRNVLKLSVWRGAPAAIHLGDTLFAMSPFQIGDRTWTVLIATPYSDISTPINTHTRNTWLVTISVLMMMYLGGYVLMRARSDANRLERDKNLLEEKVGLEEELRLGRDRLDTIIKTIPSGLFTIDREHVIRSWNLTAERVTGYSAEDVIGKNCADVFGETCDRACLMFDPGTPEKPLLGRECSMTTKDGRQITLSKNLDLIRDPDGHAVMGLESFIDITASKRAEEQRINSIALEKEIEHLRKMDEVKTNFLSMVSHELRTPLSVMLGNLSMAEKGKYGDLPEKFRERLKVVMRRGWQLNDLIDNLLDLAKIESGRVELDKQPLEVPDAVERLLVEFQEGIEEKQLRVSVSCEDDAKTIIADKNMFRHLLANLVSNAVKFTPAGGSIAISTRSRNNHVVLTVKDSGIGIPENEQPKIFDRFYQVDNTSTRQYGGTGLGLAIVKEIAQVHNASIEIESVEGEGAEIRVVFPGKLQILVAHGHVDTEQSPTALPPGAPAKSKSMLIIDTDPDTLTTITDIVEGSYIRVLYADSAREAREVIGREKVNIIVANPAAIGESCKDFLNSIGGPTAPDLRVIILSDDPLASRKAAAGLTHVAACLTKPLQQDMFAKTLQSILSI